MSQVLGNHFLQVERLVVESSLARLYHPRFTSIQYAEEETSLYYRVGCLLQAGRLSKDSMMGCHYMI